MTTRYEVQRSEKLGRYLVAARNLRAGESILTDEPFALGPASDSGLVCFNCHRQLISKFFVCKNCAVAPVCPHEGCPDDLPKWHTKSECDTFRDLKLSRGLSPLTMVQNVSALTPLRVLLKRRTHPQAWEEFLQLETHLEERRSTPVWQFCEETNKFIKSLGLLGDIKDEELVQKICAAIDVNTFEVRGPAGAGAGAGAGADAEPLTALYLRAALLAHDCAANTHVAVSDSGALVAHASVDIAKGDIIYFNYTDPLKGTALRQQHLFVGKYFKCTCARCSDPTEMGTHLSSVICPFCKTGYATQSGGQWTCHSCERKLEADVIDYKLQCCADKFDVINKKEEKELEEYIRHVSLVLAPNHYLLLEAKQRLAGVLRDSARREPRPPPSRQLRRRAQLCRDVLPVLTALAPGICRAKAITLYELHATTVQLAKKLFDAREISGTEYMDELINAEGFLKRALEMLFVEPANSPEGQLCARALEEYRALKATMSTVLDGLHAEGKSYQWGSLADRPTAGMASTVNQS